MTKLLLFLRTLERKAAVRAPDQHADASAAAHASMSTGPALGAQHTARAAALRPAGGRPLVCRTPHTVPRSAPWRPRAGDAIEHSYKRSLHPAPPGAQGR